MATPKQAKTREERAKEIPFANIISQPDGYFLVKGNHGSYLTDGKNCECGDNRYKGNDCTHAIRVRDFRAISETGQTEAAQVVNIADYR